MSDFFRFLLGLAATALCVFGTIAMLNGASGEAGLFMAAIAMAMFYVAGNSGGGSGRLWIFRFFD